MFIQQFQQRLVHVCPIPRTIDIQGVIKIGTPCGRPCEPEVVVRKAVDAIFPREQRLPPTYPLVVQVVPSEPIGWRQREQSLSAKPVDATICAHAVAKKRPVREVRAKPIVIERCLMPLRKIGGKELHLRHLRHFGQRRDEDADESCTEHLKAHDTNVGRLRTKGEKSRACGHAGGTLHNYVKRTRYGTRAHANATYPGDPEKGERSSLFRVLARTPFNPCVRAPTFFLYTYSRWVGRATTEFTRFPHTKSKLCWTPSRSVRLITR